MATCQLTLVLVHGTAHGVAISNPLSVSLLCCRQLAGVKISGQLACLAMAALFLLLRALPLTCFTDLSCTSAPGG